MQRNTKIVATLGPTTNTPELLEEIIKAGVNVVRINFSHGTAQDHIDRVKIVREIAKKLETPVAVLADLQGPKIRVGQFKDGKVNLPDGSKFILDADCKEGNEERVGLDYPQLVQDVVSGDTLLLDDGRIEMTVDKVRGNEVHCTVVHGGVLSNRKGINKMGGGLTAPALTEKDMEDVKTAVAFEADYIAVSFPKSGADMIQARELVHAAGGKALMIAKIERTEAVRDMEALIQDCDGVMVARGDLAVEIGDAAVPAVQKRLIRLARANNKLSITATQMMESMISSPVPTRAEVSDVANAVLDGTDAVMLSAETASGQYPVQTVATMARICIEAEKSQEVSLEKDFLDRTFTSIDQSVSMAALFAAHHLKVKAIATLTESGATARWMSRFNAGVPIYALTPNIATLRRLALFRDVRPVYLEKQTDRDKLLQAAEDRLLADGVVEKGDLVVLTVGEPVGKSGGTNALKIVRVGTPRE